MQAILQSDIRSLLQQGADPTKYRLALARARRCDVSEVDAAIATVGGAPADVHPEVVAQNRLYAERSMRRTAAWREANHEEN